MPYRDELIYAAEHGDINEVRRILASPNPMVNTIDEEGYTAAIVAAKQNNYKILEILLNAGADPNLKAGITIPTAIEWARMNENPEMIKLLENRPRLASPQL